MSDVHGLTFRYANREQLVTWDQMGLVERTSSGMGQKPIINLYDRNGKHLATIDNGFEHFEAVAKWLEDRVKSTAGEPMVGMLKLKRHRRIGLGALVFGIVIMAGVVGLGCEAYYSNREEKLLRTSSVVGEAEIVELVTAPNGRTKRVYYKVVHEDQRGPQENVEVDEFTWQSLHDQSSVPVRYVPSELSVSELVSGEVKQNNFTDTLAGKITLLSIASIFGLGLVVCGTLMCKGWILETDPVTKKNRFYRLPAAS